MHKILNVKDYFQVTMRSGKMHFECGGPAGSSDWRYRPEATRPRHEMVAQCPVAGTAGGASGKTTAWPDEVALMDETH
jgi:hypothetical protein